MQIGFYHDAAGTRHAGGIAVYTQQLAAALSGSNDVYLYTQRGELSSVLTESDVTVVETPSFDDHWLHSIDALSPLTDQDHSKLLMTYWAARNDVIDHMDDHLDVLVTAQFLDDLLLSNLTDVPTIYTFHQFSDVGLGIKLRDALSRTELILANSDDTARKVSETFDCDIGEVIYPGIDPDQFRPGVDPAIDGDDPIILFVGRLIEAKGIGDLLEAVSHLEGRQELHVVGRGDDQWVRRRARSLGISDAVVIHGEVPNAELPSYHAGADVFCLPSHDESFGMANVEAMACELPVVTTDLEGIETYLANGENGLLARVGDPRDLADKLTMLLDSPRLRERLGARAREDVRRFSWDEQARNLERFCYEALDIDAPADRPEPEPVPKV
ncbi:glycosyltransferase family 4 protein [Natronorubrum sp. DTA7]|uniref:glycosyltransferase family 4 protein n=1 Tax=Natronorubrum sp. DTA7 TaxID=3447016 RepID=UPI003F83A069